MSRTIQSAGKVRARDARHLPVASALAGLAEPDAAALLLGRQVRLDWTDACEATTAGRTLVLTAANLMVRFCPQVRIARDTLLGQEAARLVAEIDSAADPFGKIDGPAVRVHLGGGENAADVTGSADGWLALAGRHPDLPPLADSSIKVGAHAAGGLVAACTFAALLDLGVEAGSAWSGGWSLLDYRTGRSTHGPLSDIALPPDVLLVGAGAVGQAVIDVLASAGLSGSLRVLDFGRVDDVTNLNRLFREHAPRSTRRPRTDRRLAWLPRRRPRRRRLPRALAYG